MEDPRYPIGEFKWKGGMTADEREAAIRAVEGLPGKLRAAVEGLGEARLETPYRAGGWTARQVVHHVPDSHMNAYVRTKLALTEDEPTIKPYDEARWAELADSRMPVEGSLRMLEALHGRWAALWRSMDEREFARRLRHPERGTMTLEEVLALYAWHGAHHLAHVESVAERERTA